MKLFSISKSVNVPKFKPTTHFDVIHEVERGKLMVYSMAQQHNITCKALVKRGDRVLVNQVIGTSDNQSAVPVYSGVSGTVKQIANRIDLSGNSVSCVIVENDGLYEEEPIAPYAYNRLTFPELKEAVKNLGLVENQNLSNRKRGMHLSFREKAKSIVVNAQESSLYGQVDPFLYLSEKEDFLRGLEVLKTLYPGAHITVFTTSDADSLIGFKSILEDTGVHLMSKIPSQYYHDMNLAARAVYGDFNMKSTLVLDAFNLPAIARGLLDHKITHYQMILVNGEAAKKPGIYRVPEGTTLSAVMEAAQVEKPFRIVAGSILSGDAVFNTEAPLNRGIKELLFLSEAEVSPEEEVNCIKCGRCADICPMALQPYELNQLVMIRDFDGFFKARGGMCVECGLCSYVCPSKRHLLQSFKTAKKVKR